MQTADLAEGSNLARVTTTDHTGLPGYTKPRWRSRSRHTRSTNGFLLESSQTGLIALTWHAIREPGAGCGGGAANRRLLRPKARTVPV